MSLSTDYSTAKNQANVPLLDSNHIDLSHLNVDARAVLTFWFDKENERYWFEENMEFDQQIRERFGKIWQAAKQGECATWRIAEAPTDCNSSITALAGRLAEIIILDQFSRNLCRNQPCAFAQDGMALVLAQEAIQKPYFDTLPMVWRKFIIMPFMHSESTAIHERYLPLFEKLDDKVTLEFAQQHKEIIEQFGRYPHRNAALSRESTVEELDFLQQPNSSF